MKDLLKNKPFIGVIIALLVGLVSAFVGFDVKEQLCGAPVAQVAPVAPEAVPAK